MSDESQIHASSALAGKLPVAPGAVVLKRGFQTVWELLKQHSDSIGVAGTAIGLVGLIVGVWFWYNPRERRKKLFVTYQHVELIRDATTLVPELTLSFRGYGGSLNNVTVTVMHVWNSGPTIRKVDFAPTAPLQVCTDDETVILSFLIGKATANCPVSGAKSKERDVIRLSFDHFDNGDGFAMVVYHSGTRTRPIRLDGKLLGGEIREVREDEGLIFSPASLAMLAIGLLIGVATAIIPGQNSVRFAFVGLVGFTCGRIAVRISRLNFTHRRVPKHIR